MMIIHIFMLQHLLSGDKLHSVYHAVVCGVHTPFVHNMVTDLF